MIPYKLKYLRELLDSQKDLPGDTEILWESRKGKFVEIPFFSFMMKTMKEKGALVLTCGSQRKGRRPIIKSEDPEDPDLIGSKDDGSDSPEEMKANEHGETVWIFPPSKKKKR